MQSSKRRLAPACFAAKHAGAMPYPNAGEQISAKMPANGMLAPQP
jgi:hypothetical protein